MVEHGAGHRRVAEDPGALSPRTEPRPSSAGTGRVAGSLASRPRRFGAALGLGVALATPGLGADAPPPDFEGSLRAGLPVRAWFDAGRQRGFVQVAGFTSRLYRAWSIAVGDLDGDGTREILLGIWSTTRRHDEPEPHSTVWVLAWDDARGELRERWRGSALSRPLLDFTVRDDRLLATERLGGGCVLTNYDWTGFGFAARARRPAACEGR